MHTTWSSINGCPIVFQGHPSNFKVTRLSNLRFWFKLGVSGLQLQFEFTNGNEMMHNAWSSIEEVPYCFSRSSVKFQGHKALKIVEFDPNWAFSVSNCSLNSPMTMKWCTQLEIAQKWCPIAFQGHPSNFKVTWLQNCRFWPKLGVSGRWLQFELTDEIEKMHKAWCSTEAEPYYFSGSPIKFKGHMGWKIDDLNPIWVRLLGRSQLSNPSDLPCFQ